MAQIPVNLDDELVTGLERIAQSRNIPVDEAAAFLLERALSGVSHGQPPLIGDYKPQHIPIMLDPKEDRQKKVFRCINCGCAVFNYYGGVKLITHGVYDADQNIIDGDDVDWFTKIGVPEELICSGRIVVRLPNGRTAKKRCSTVYYRIGV